MDTLRSFGDLLRKLREEAGVRLTTLARDLGISAPYLSDIERGNRMPPHKPRILVIAGILKLTAQDSKALLDAANLSRGVFELSVEEATPAKRELGLALARGWEELEDSDAEAVYDFWIDLMNEKGKERM